MYLKFDADFLDFDLSFLQDLFALLDGRFDDLQQRIEESSDPDGMGLFDIGEYLAGMGFVACQRYLASTYGPNDLAKKAALAIGPYHEGGEPVARILNAAANYWKHEDEWDTNAVIARNADDLKPQQKDTIRIIETVTPWSDYTCVNLLAALSDSKTPRVATLIPFLEAWRKQLDGAKVRITNG